jgi:hypothetical protein
MALAADRNTPMKEGEILPYLVAANAVIFAGGLVVANAGGFAAPGSTAVGLAALGRAEEAVDNTGGANGAKTVRVRRGQVFKFANSGVDPVLQAGVGRLCYIVDDEMVAATDGGGTRSAAGIVAAVDASGVWVEI